MGSSKKHKERDREKDHKRKRKHRSRSRSRSRDRNKRRKDERRHKHDKDDPHAGYPESRADGRTDGRADYPEARSDSRVKTVKDDIDPMDKGGGENLSLSIEDTNKIRAKLGLKPLELPGAPVTDDPKSTKKEDVHVPAVNLSNLKKTEELREKMKQMREKRRINMKLGKVKALADSDSEDDALAWVRKSRKLQEDKAKAQRQAKLLEEMDAEFGVTDLVDEAFEVKPKYSSAHLTGMRVKHDQASFKEGRNIILTLEDKGVLDDDKEDVLVNVNIEDNERADVNVQNKLKKPDYNPYADELDEYGQVKPKDILQKYNEEIEGPKKEYFTLGSGGKYNTDREKREQSIKQEMRLRAETLSLPAPNLASEFFTTDEMTSFNKVKKKARKIRKKPKLVRARDLLPMANSAGDDMGTRGIKKEELGTDVPPEMIERTGAIPGLDLVEDMDLDNEGLDENEILGPEEDLTNVVIEEDTALNELHSVLEKTRKLKQKKEKKDIHVADMVLSIKQEQSPQREVPSDLLLEDHQDKIVLNATSEFCRVLGEIPSYSMTTAKHEEEDDLMDFEQELTEQRRITDHGEEPDQQAGWQSVQIDTRPVEIKEEEKNVLDDEPVVNEGLAAALSLASKKGYLEKEVKKSVSAPKHLELQAKNYSIEDKRYDDLDEKYRKRDRYVGGMVSDFKEKPSYEPDVKLEYIDEAGRMMNAKEAFRYLSHRFHGKGSGKKKTEKRQKKLEEEQLMKSMSSTDTPLNTVALLQEKQRTDKTPYIVLSGNAKGTTSLSK